MAEHWDHDIHGPVLLRYPDGSINVDPDCDCPRDCRECEIDGVVRDPEVVS